MASPIHHHCSKGKSINNQQIGYYHTVEDVDFGTNRKFTIEPDLNGLSITFEGSDSVIILDLESNSVKVLFQSDENADTHTIKTIELEDKRD